MEIFLKPLLHEDPYRHEIYAWKQDPETLVFSLNQTGLPYEQFIEEFDSKFASLSDLPPLWILRENQRVGLIYFSPWFREKSVEISVFLDPKTKGQKIGPRALEMATNFVLEAGYEEINALVKLGNIRAQKAFEKAGFALDGDVSFSKYGEYHKTLKFRFLQKKAPSRVFVIGEAGSNFHVGHEGEDLVQAKKLILTAYQAQCDAVKFQLYDGKSVYAEGAGSPFYLNEDINLLFAEYALPHSFLTELSQYCTFLGIEFMCSSFSIEHMKLIDPYVKRHKIASYEIRHLRLLQEAAASCKPLILSTGASTEEDIAWALDIFKEHGGKEITLLHCNAQYPAASEGLNLRCIEGLREKFNVPCGFSDHSLHPLHAPLLAVALGACVIEKHFTLNKQSKGPDHFFALDPKELKEMVKGIREAEKMLGVAKKDLFPQEEELVLFARRGLHALKRIEKGEPFIENENVAILRSGNRQPGLHPSHLNSILKSKARQPIAKDEGIQHCDVAWD
jgi:N-acetylneuraminate synthase